MQLYGGVGTREVRQRMRSLDEGGVDTRRASVDTPSASINTQ